jgi:hypothetical protein
MTFLIFDLRFLIGNQSGPRRCCRVGGVSTRALRSKDGKGRSIVTSWPTIKMGKNCRAYRFVPAGTAWYRLVPDKFFSPHENGEENLPRGLGPASEAGTTCRGGPLGAAWGRFRKWRSLASIVIFRIFPTISQPQGIGFSPVTPIPGKNFSRRIGIRINARHRGRRIRHNKHNKTRWWRINNLCSLTFEMVM